MVILAKGSKAYLDSFAGPVPCKVLSIKGERGGTPGTGQRVTVVLTASRGAYRKGEAMDSFGMYVVPRAAMHVRSGQYRIGAYIVQLD